MRKPEYQVATKIINNEEKKMVVKLPSFDVAKKQIDTIKGNFLKLQDYYTSIKILPYSEYDNGLAFEYVNGKSLLDGIDFSKDDINLIVDRLKSLLQIVFDIREEFYVDFYMTDEFKSVFTDCEPQDGVRSLKVSNLDSIFSNFIETDDGLVCLDYEWVIDFPIPVDFLKYRVLSYLYNDVAAYMSSRIEINDFIDCFGLSKDDVLLYKKMDDCFQEIVHGSGRKYSYLSNYTKMVSEFSELNSIEEYNRLIETKDQHIENITHVNEILRGQLDELNDHIAELRDGIKELQDDNEQKVEEIVEKNVLLNERLNIIKRQEKDIIDRDEAIQLLSGRMAKIKRCFKNPFYGLYSLVTFFPRRIKQKRKNKKAEELERLRLEEEERIKKEKELKRQLFLAETEDNYEVWVRNEEESYNHSEVFDYNPLISVVVPVYNVEDDMLIECIESVKQQYYKKWELILVDDCSDYPNVKKTLKYYKRKNRRIKAVFRKENGRISACTNTGIKKAKGEYIAFMDCDDVIAPFALYEVVKLINKNPNLDFIYSDEDKINEEGTIRHTPFFKPDWSPDSLMSYMYTSHLGVYRTRIVKELNGLDSKYDGCQDYDMTLRFTEKTNNVGHVSKILYHWREREGSTALNPEAKSYVKDATQKCKEAALERRGLKGSVEWIDDIYQFRVNYHVQNNPLVSIIIPSKDNPQILKQCLESLVNITKYNKYEIVVVDNGSGEENKLLYNSLFDEIRAIYKNKNEAQAEELEIKYIYEKSDFNFSHMCNTGVNSSSGKYLLFLNDDIEIVEAEWLERMLGQAELSHVGAVGAKLLYPGTSLIQHDGVVSLESGPVHYLAKMDDGVSYYFNRNRLDFDVSAVTAACLLLDRNKFDEIEGFNEELAVAYNDIDFCYKLIEKGYFNVIRNDVILYHHESISRGDDAMDSNKFARLMREQEKLYNRHPQFKGRDSFYNENLTQIDCNFKVNYEKNRVYSVEATDVSAYEVDETIRYGVDIARNDWCLYLEGWAFKEAYDDNLNLETMFILKGKNRSYVINTFPIKREDVVETFSLERGILFCGCKARINRGVIEPGEYEIRIICNGKIANTEKRNIDSIETLII